MSAAPNARNDPPEPDSGQAQLPGLDLAAVIGWLRESGLQVFSAQPSARLIAGGRSNLTYLLDDGQRRAVLRRPPLGHVLATAHDMEREHRVLSALVQTAVPVPQPLALCPDPTVTGAPFYLMSFVDGLIVRHPADVEPLDAGQRDGLARAMVDVLADLHAVDPDAVGLTGFGRPEGYLERQLRRWSAQLEASRSRDLPGIEALRDALSAGVPDAGAAVGPAGCVLHGDFRLDNLVVSDPRRPVAEDGAGPEPAAGVPEVLAVLDWEMSTLGDPLADLGLLLAYWDGLGQLPNPVVEAIGPQAGFPPGPTLADWYAERSGTDISGLPWYVAFGFFKIAVILEGIHYRFVRGGTVGPGFDRIGPLVPALVELGRLALPEGGAR